MSSMLKYRVKSFTASCQITLLSILATGGAFLLLYIALKSIRASLLVMANLPLALIGGIVTSNFSEYDRDPRALSEIRRGRSSCQNGRLSVRTGLGHTGLIRQPGPKLAAVFAFLDVESRVGKSVDELIALITTSDYTPWPLKRCCT